MYLEVFRPVTEAACCKGHHYAGLNASTVAFVCCGWYHRPFRGPPRIVDLITISNAESVSRAPNKWICLGVGGRCGALLDGVTIMVHSGAIRARDLQLLSNPPRQVYQLQWIFLYTEKWTHIVFKNGRKNSMYCGLRYAAHQCCSHRIWERENIQLYEFAEYTDIQWKCLI